MGSILRIGDQQARRGLYPGPVEKEIEDIIYSGFINIINVYKNEIISKLIILKTTLTHLKVLVRSY